MTRSSGCGIQGYNDAVENGFLIYRREYNPQAFSAERVSRGVILPPESFFYSPIERITFMKIGIGTYSFGGIASILGLGPTLKEQFEAAKKIGFEQVELLQVNLSHPPEDIKKWLDETGLEVVSVHAEPTEETIKAMAAIGGKAVIWPQTPFCNKAEAIEVARHLEKMAEFAEPLGVKVGYHNHSWEFFTCEGKSLLEHLLDGGTKFYAQLDCGWAMNGGIYPSYFIRKYKNRILSIHVKENSKVNGPGGVPASRHDESTRKSPFGDGNIMDKPVEERQKILEQITERIKAGSYQMNNQCKIGAPESNIDWLDVKKALDEQDFAADWIVEREGFYDEHDKCLADDYAWLKANIK